jgi:NAD+ synthase (glutamine-hydrolysing)
VDIDKIAAVRIQNQALRQSMSQADYRVVEVPMCDNLEEMFVRREYSRFPFVEQEPLKLKSQCDEIFEIQVNSFAQRYTASHSKCAVIGVSGGVDSTLALLVVASAMDKLGLSRKNILGVTMPGFGTTGRTYNNAVSLMQSLGIMTREVSIKEACLQHFKDIGISEDDRSVTYENSQARERTQILMDIANKEGGLVVGTGDLSEVALGWATYNGDHMSMYGVNASVPKTLIRHMLRHIASMPIYKEAEPYLLDIVDTPISPELLPADKSGNIAQKTEDLLGPYELHDFFIYHFIRYGYRPSQLYFMARKTFADYEPSTIKRWLIIFLRRFFNQQFKRSAMPDGPQTGCITLAPRGGWIRPSDTQSALWLAEADELED